MTGNLSHVQLCVLYIPQRMDSKQCQKAFCTLRVNFFVRCGVGTGHADTGSSPELAHLQHLQAAAT